MWDGVKREPVAFKFLRKSKAVAIQEENSKIKKKLELLVSSR